MKSKISSSATESSKISKLSVSDEHEPVVASTSRLSESKVDAANQPIQSQSIERTSLSLPNITTTGFHMPTQVLGQISRTEQDPMQQPRRTIEVANVNTRARKRSSRAVKATKSPAATAAAAAQAKSGTDDPSKLISEASIFTLLTYKGMEVIFSNTSTQRIVGVCSRTHLLFQTLQLASDSAVVSLTSNSYTGIVIVAHEDGTIQTYNPISRDQSHFNEQTQTNASTFPIGKFRWVDGHTIDASQVFYQASERVGFQDRRSTTAGKLVDISSSCDHKMLVAHRNQLALFEVAPIDVSKDRKQSSTSVGAIVTLLWTTLLQSNIVAAKISGDGQAIVVVSDGPNEAGNFGAQTFLHDIEDGSNPLSRPSLERSSSVGMVFKPGPFLQHSTAITRLSFRGLGRMTSAVTEDDGQGNDLLLTHCDGDSTVRIFNQNSWQQLMLWSAPPNSRADWIRGSSAFSLGEFDSQKKVKNPGSKPTSRRPSASSAETSTGTSINAGLRNIRSPGSGAPTTTAGAWIAEITFRDAFPALRLSRLSYMKRGNDDSQPAHFESVAAILPAGSIVASSVLKSDDMGLTIQGVWPAWNPWLSETTLDASSNTLSGSAMQFLGLSSVPPPSGSYFGESYLGGTHSPPTELRIAASHPKTGNLVLMEFPLWGDEDFGAMELGSPIRSVLSLSDVLTSSSGEPLTKQRNISALSVSMDYECSRICARVEPGNRSVSLLWRKQGTMSLYSPGSQSSNGKTKAKTSSTPELLYDVSMIPAPLVLPPLHLPSGKVSADHDTLVAIKWWADNSFGGPPLLLAITRSSTLLVFEIPPPWCVREPEMPNYDPFNSTSPSGSVSDLYESGVPESASARDDDIEVVTRREYDVMVTPHPDFGLGLRLESPMDGLPAVAGSFKKHPLNGGMLPAEKTGMIVLGDELLNVNGVSLESMTFDDIIATVRHVGAEAGAGKPLTLRFRPVSSGSIPGNSPVLHEPYSSRPLDAGSNTEAESVTARRSIIGRSPKTQTKLDSSSHSNHSSDSNSFAGLVRSFGESQQEFGRMIAVIRNAFPMVTEKDLSSRLLLLPWVGGIGAPSPNKLRGAALLLIGIHNSVHAKRIEIPLNSNPDKASLFDIGSINLKEEASGEETKAARTVEICQMKVVETVGERRCCTILDSQGTVRLLSFSFTEKHSTNQKDLSAGEPTWILSFKQFKIFELGAASLGFQIEASSINLFATSEKKDVGDSCRIIKVWSSRPDPCCRPPVSEQSIRDEYFEQDYWPSIIEVESSDWNSTMIDFRFLKTGLLDSFPALVVFLQSEVVVYQRRGGCLEWLPSLRIAYSSIPTSGLASLISPNFGSLSCDVPCDAYPHLLPSIRASLSSYDENHYMTSDWHPESLLAHMCTDDRGVKVALDSHLKPTLIWLFERIESSSVESTYPCDVPLLVTPFDSVGGCFLLEKQSEEIGRNDMEERAFDIMKATTSAERGSHIDESVMKLQKLLTLIASPRYLKKTVDTSGKSQEFKLAMSSRSARERYEEEGRDSELSPVLDSLQPTELRTLWAIANIVVSPPDFRGLDPQGQFALMIYSVHEALKNSPHREAGQSTERTSSPPAKSQFSSFFVKRQSSNPNGGKKNLSPPKASAGCISALLCGQQGHLLETLRKTFPTFDWPCMRELRVPFWIRSDDSLRQLAEEIGQNLYRESRDILKSALFFLISGKKRTLRNLAAADNTESGKKFFKFLTGFDFASDRGRSAAEKNAFSLLRKNRYDCAAAFFLLAEPPSLKSAVEIIATKMEDLDLAFMVARLVENLPKTSGQAFGSASMMGFGSTVFGGGGGYAGMGTKHDFEYTKDERPFKLWKANLGKAATRLILDRGLPDSRHDSSFSAVQLVWLGRHDEAEQWLSGFLGCPDGVLPRFLPDVPLPRLYQDTVFARKSKDSTISMVNSFINFVSGPFLLKSMKASSRTSHASALLVSSSLSRLGIDLPAYRTLIRNFDTSEFKELSADDETPSKDDENVTKEGSPRSSVFDGFEVAPQRAYKASVTEVRGERASSSSRAHAKASTSDSYGDPRPRPFPNEGAIASSIFDDFDVAPKKLTAPDSTGAMVSSIFDSFDAPPASKAKANPRVTAPDVNGGMVSSIFDSFDAPPASKPINSGLPKTPAQDATGGMVSSIFDSFDVPPPNNNNESMQSSSLNKLAPSLASISRLEGTPISKKRGHARVTADEGNDIEVNQASHRNLPLLWIEWCEQLKIDLAAKRLFREMVTLGTTFHGELFEAATSPLGNQDSPAIPSNASQVLQFHCNGDDLMDNVNSILGKICTTWKLDKVVVVNRALHLLECPYHYHRVCFAVLLHLILKQADLAEDVVRSAAHSVTEKCLSLAFTNDEVSNNQRSIYQVSTHHLRKVSAQLSWQLELCLWMHRGGLLPLSGMALNEAICAVRIGLLVSSWNRDFASIETMIRQPPDCLTDDDAGRQLWTSLKILSSSTEYDRKSSGTSSGGWEFLVDCRRAEATELLRQRPTGCFIIRPHSGDHGVFTLSFKTNLVPTIESDVVDGNSRDLKNANQSEASQNRVQKASSSRSVKRDDVVQHAIIRLSDSGFRCGSFGPFATLMNLLEAVSSSLPFDLRFDHPPTEGVRKEEGSKPSPNSAFFRKLGLCQAENTIPRPLFDDPVGVFNDKENSRILENECKDDMNMLTKEEAIEKEKEDGERRNNFFHFLELLVLSEIRKQLCCVAAAKYESIDWREIDDEANSVGSISEGSSEVGPEKAFASAARILRPLLTWCRTKEIDVVSALGPHLNEVSGGTPFPPVALNASETAIEFSTTEGSSGFVGGDAVMRRMIQPGSGVEFRTLRLGDGSESAMVVLFSKKEAVGWFLKNSIEKSEEDALKRLTMMEKTRVIEPLDLKMLSPKSYKKSKQEEEDEKQLNSSGELVGKGTRYRLVDPWEVEPLDCREAETRGASLGRHRFLAFDLGRIAASCEGIFRSIGGPQMLELWATARGGVSLTKAIACIHPPWERASGGDLQLRNGSVTEPVAYVNSIRQHLYRNAIFRTLDLPQRFLALIQVELLDLKNLTSPGGSLSLTVYSLLRLKRSRSRAPLTVKARTLDSVATHPVKLGKSSGPNAPATWGSLVRFRFPLPEYTAADGRSYDGNREALFKGPPSVLQVSVYEKKFMSDVFLGGADVKLDGLSSGGQLEEWVPLRMETQGINWFARIRLTLRFELMCLSPEGETMESLDELAPSVGLRRIQQLSDIGGVQEDMKKSVSTPDLLSYFESMVS